MLCGFLLLFLGLLTSTASPASGIALFPRQEATPHTPPISSGFPTAISDHSPLTLGQPNLTYWTSTCNFNYLCNRQTGKTNFGKLPSDIWNWWVGEQRHTGANCAVALYFTERANPSPSECNTHFDDAISLGERDKTSFRAGYNIRPGSFPADLDTTFAGPRTYSTSQPGWNGQQFPDQASYVVLGMA